MPDAILPRKSLTTRIPAAELPTQASLMTLAVSVVVVSALYVAREVLIPVTLAVLLSFVLVPLVSRLRRLGLWRVPSVLLAVLLALGVIAGLGTVIGTQVAQLGSEAGSYSQTVREKFGRIRSVLTEQVGQLTSRMGVETPRPEPRPARPAASVGGPQPAAAPRPTPVEVHEPDPTPFQVLERLVSPLLGPLGSIGIMLVLTVFILMQMEDLRDRMIRLFGSSDLHRTTAAMDDAAARLSRYFLTQLALNAGFGVVVALGLLVIGVPSPALFGIIASLFRFVPYVGALGAAALPVLLAAAVDPGWTLVLETVAMFVLIEAIVGQVIEPLAYGHSTGLSPVSVVLSAIFWAWLWGPVGLILSMPLTLCLVVLGRHVEHLQFLDVLLGDRPALTPAESFYQRMLAGDADEALDQAEILLRDRSLSAYYDEVAMRGLQMAANDSLRGVLTAEQLANIQEAISGLVMDLAGEEDPGPRGQGTLPGTVLCVGGRGPLDEAACAMLAQILAKRGMNARVVGAAAVTRTATESLDLTGVGVICIAYLEAEGSLSALRYLVRRLRQRAPGVPCLVGLWQPESVDRERLRAVSGADDTIETIAGAAEACLARLEPPAEPAAELATVAA